MAADPLLAAGLSRQPAQGRRRGGCVGVGAAGAPKPGVRHARRRARPVRALYGVRGAPRVRRLRHVAATRAGTERDSGRGLYRRHHSAGRSRGDRHGQGRRVGGRPRARHCRGLRRARRSADGLGVDLPLQGRARRLHPRLCDRHRDQPVVQVARRAADRRKLRRGIDRDRGEDPGHELDHAAGRCRDAHAAAGDALPASEVAAGAHRGDARDRRLGRARPR